MSESTLGLEIDGEQVTVVETIGDMAVSVRSLSLDNLTEAVDLVLAGYKVKRNDPPLRVVAVTNKTVIRKIDATSSMSTRTGFEEGVYQAVRTSRENTVTAGVFTDIEKIQSGIDALSTAYAVVAPRESVDIIFNALGKRNVEIVTPAFTIPYDGLWLGVRYSTADLTLVRDGRPVAYRQLPAGGLSTVIGLLTDVDDLSLGEERLQTALHRSGPNDPIAEAELDRYIRLLAAETKQTIEYFTRDGEQVPDTIQVYGPGSVAVGFDSVFNEMGIKFSMPEELTRNLSFIPPADRPIALAAYFAAITTGNDSPYATYPDPRDSNKVTVKRVINKKPVKLTIATVVFLALLGYNALPSGTAYLERNSLRSERDAIQNILNKESDLITQVTTYRTRSALISDIKESELNPSIPLRVIKETTPSNTMILQVTSSIDDSGNLILIVSADKMQGSYNDLSRWLSDLRRDEAVISAWSNSFTNRSGKASYQLTVVFENKKILRYNQEIKDTSSLTENLVESNVEPLPTPSPEVTPNQGINNTSEVGNG